MPRPTAWPFCLPPHTAKHCRDCILYLAKMSPSPPTPTGDRVGQSLPSYTSLCLGPSVNGEGLGGA